LLEANKTLKLCIKILEFLNVTAGVIYSYH